MEALTKIFYAASLSTVLFVCGELLKKNHSFQEFRFFWKNLFLFPKKVQKNMKAGLLDQIMACSINYRHNTNKSHPAGAKIAYFDHSAHGLKHDQFRGENYTTKFYENNFVV